MYSVPHYRIICFLIIEYFLQGLKIPNDVFIHPNNKVMKAQISNFNHYLQNQHVMLFLMYFLKMISMNKSCWYAAHHQFFGIHPTQGCIKKSIFWILTTCITELQLKILFTKYISSTDIPSLDKKLILFYYYIYHHKHRFC